MGAVPALPTVGVCGTMQSLLVSPLLARQAAPMTLLGRALALLLALLGVLAPLSVDTYLPAFAGLEQSLGD